MEVQSWNIQNNNISAAFLNTDAILLMSGSVFILKFHFNQVSLHKFRSRIIIIIIIIDFQQRFNFILFAQDIDSECFFQRYNICYSCRYELEKMQDALLKASDATAST